MCHPVKRVIAGTGLLSVMPIVIWLTGWQWHPTGNTLWLQGLYGLTQTVTSPWGIGTSVILTCWFLWCLRLRAKQALVVSLLLFASISLGQGIKSFIKEQVQETRPFITLLQSTRQIDEKDFYALTRQQRAELIKQQLQTQTLVPAWLGRYWQFDTGFSFPSGHTLFVATWALLGVGLLWPGRHYKTVLILMLWATGVMGSRLALGMHWPQDLIASVIISGLLVSIFCVLVQRWLVPDDVALK